MLGRYSMNDSVRVVLATSINSVANTITFNAAVSPFNNPADPVGDAASGGFGIATLTDSLTQPTKFEIVLYDALDDNGDGTLSLRHCVRGAAGSTAQSWTAGAVIYQALTSEGLLHPFITVDQTASGGLVSFSAHTEVLSGKGTTWRPGLGTAYSKAQFSGFEASNTGIGGRTGFYLNTGYFAGSTTEDGGSLTALVGATSTAGPRLALAKGRGTDALTAVQVGDELGSIRWYARHATSNWAQPARIVSTVTSISGSAVKSAVVVEASSNGTSAPTEIARLYHNGTTPAADFTGAVGIGGPAVSILPLVVYGNASFTANVIAAGDVEAQGTLKNGWWHKRPTLSSATAPTASVNNAAMPAADTGAIRLTGSGGGTWTGLTGGSLGRVVTLINASTGSITLAHENASSTAANRFALPGSANYVIAANACATLWYDGTSSRWRVLT